jgi:restriction system protein
MKIFLERGKTQFKDGKKVDKLITAYEKYAKYSDLASDMGKQLVPTKLGDTYNTFDLSKLQGKHKDYSLTLELTADLQDFRDIFANEGFKDNEILEMIRYNKALSDSDYELFEKAVKIVVNLRYVDVRILVSKLGVELEKGETIVEQLQSNGIIGKSDINGIHEVVKFQCIREDLRRAADYALKSRFVSVDTLIKTLRIPGDSAVSIMKSMQELGIIEGGNISEPREAIITESQWQRRKYVENPKHYDDMDGHEFEYFCADLLRNNGYINVEVTSGSGDFGVDITAEKQNGTTYAVQCKRYATNIGVDAVQQIYAGKTYYKRHVGIVMTNQYFTPAAVKAAKETGVLLWDRDYLERYNESNYEVYQMQS